MSRATRWLALVLGLAAAAAGLAAAKAPVAWDDLTPADWLYDVATRFADVDGHRVHYKTPTAELARLLEARAEVDAKRHLADARLALGDRPGAVAAIEAWAEADGPQAWADAARWGAQQGETALAFRAAARALPGLDDEAKVALARERVAWADAHPDVADPLAMRAERAALRPADGAAAEDWIRALEKAGRVDEAIAAAEKTTALAPERRLLLRSDLAADHGDSARAFALLDASVERDDGWPTELKRAYAQRTDAARPGAPESWRASLDRAFDAPSLVRLATWFEGKDRGDRAADLLRQVERRQGERLDAAGWRLLSRLHGDIDSVPDAFRSRLAAAAKSNGAEAIDDLAALARLALRAGARPLGWGAYDEEPYRWAAAVDRTPGFWTGGVSFLLTGTDWKDALARLETDSLPDRTFATALALVAELEKRAPSHAALPGLRAAILARHVERGEGQKALALLPLVENGPKDAADEARRAALLAMRQVEVPLAEETRVWRARLAALSPDGSRPATRAPAHDWSPPETTPGAAWARSLPEPRVERYKDALDEAVARLDQRDASHRAAVGLLLSEMDRLPHADDLWQELAQRLESWNLDDELGPRYEHALAQFDEPGWWPRAARWYARRSRHRELDRLATELAARFRGTAVFSRAPLDDGVRLEAPDEPRVGTRVRLVAWADWVRLKALERFPHSPAVFREAQARLVRRSAMADAPGKRRGDRVLVDDALVDERGWAVLFADAGRREPYLADAVRTGALPARIAAWEARPVRTPVEDLLLFEGRARLSQFEEAAAPAERLAAAYPGDGDLARRVLSLHRSLASLDPSGAAAAEALVARTAPALADPGALWTELGEMEHERGRPDRAKDAWRHLLDRSPRDAGRVEDLATVLWDYGETGDALATIEDARRRLARPTLLAFEAGVLHEEKHDVDGALREYLAAGLPGDDRDDCFCSAFERDQRALRRLSQLVGRPRVRSAIEARLDRLTPGGTADERTLVALLPLATIRMPDADLDWTADDWIDAMDHPVDPVAREARRDDRERWRAAAREGQAEVAARLLARTRAMVDAATGPSFLDAVERWAKPLFAAQATREDDVALTAAVMGRRAALATGAEDRVTREIERARYLFENGRRAEADEAWRMIASRVASLPEGAPRLRAEAERAAYVERAQGAAAAAVEWERLAARYPWSLGILEDRVAFLTRADRGSDARATLEQAAGRAAAGHREALLERLARESIEAQDLAQAQRAVETMLGLPSLEDGPRLSAVHLLARLQLRRDAAFDVAALAEREEPRLVRPESRAELHAQLARAAALESRFSASVSEWLEALNRRVDRGWLREACTAAERGGDPAPFVSFFDRQRERSPRDVRWAVAQREIRLFFDDEKGAIEAARAAIAVRPDRGSLWYETADLLARLGRPREGAGLLRDWVKTRPGDEAAAGRRSALLAAAGDVDAALAVERQALAAYTTASPRDEEHAAERRERRGRASRRLLDLGLPQQAWSLLATGPRGDRLVDSGLGPYGEAELAIAAGRYLPLLERRLAAASASADAEASVLAERGRPEQKEEVVAWVVGEILPEPPATATLGIEKVWPFAQQAGLDEAVRIALARRVLARTPGPWAKAPPESFVDAVSTTLIGDPPKRLAPPLERLWVADLARRGRTAELWAFLAPRWDALVALVRSTAPVASRTERLDWPAWLDDKDALAAWADGAARDAAGLSTLSSLMGERRAWDRLWALAARGWDTGPLVAALPDDARTQWFRLWQRPSPTDPNPAVRARGETVERAQAAIGRLTAGRDGAADDPVIAGLLGPGTIGGILDESGPRWDTDLWGERPAPGWLVLQTLVRHTRKGENAALVPLEVMDRGGETRRSRLASRLAEADGDAAVALVLASDVPAATTSDLARRLRLLHSAGRTEEASAALRDEVRRRQPRIDEATYRALARTAEDLGLPDPLTLLDPAAPVPGPFAAFVCDRRGLVAGAGLKAIAPADFRTALAARYAQRPRPLSAEEARYALLELWSNDAGPLPSGLRRLGGLWPHAAPWLASVRTGDRREAVAALDALPDDARLQALLGRTPGPPSEAARLLLVRVHLLRREDEKAATLFRQRLAELDSTGSLAFAPVVVSEGEGDGEGDDAEVAPRDEASPGDPFTNGLRSWLAPFREAKKTALVADAVRASIERRTLGSPRSPASWALALDLSAAGPDRDRALRQLERAWRLGDLDAEALAPVVESAARVSPFDGERWLARLGAGAAFDAAMSRARLVASVGRKPDAAAGLARARAQAAWTAIDEVKAFDLWRSLAPAADPDAPGPWTAARRFWTRPAADPGADLGEHLRAHPLDVRAARAALRSVAPGDPDAMELARRALAQAAASERGDPWGDGRVLSLRAARSLAAVSPMAARSMLGGFDPSLAADLDRRRLPAAEVRAALADVARASAASGDTAAADAALAAFEDRAPADARALRAQVRAGAPVAPLRPYRLLDGRPEPWRPRDLDWSAVEVLLDREGVR